MKFLRPNKDGAQFYFVIPLLYTKYHKTNVVNGKFTTLFILLGLINEIYFKKKLINFLINIGKKVKFNDF